VFNKIYKKDNLELMKEIPDNTLDVIYSDILYATGRNFDDYIDLPYDKKSVEDFYIPRLKEMYRILKPTGSLWIQCDFHIIHWIRCILDDIFGYKNCVNEVIWKYKSGGSTNKKLSSKHDNICVYSKDIKKYKFNPLKEKSYNRGFKPYRFKGVEEFQDDEGKWYTMINMQDVWEINMVGRTSKERVDYSTQKPLELMERIITLTTDEGDTVADFFMGSGGFLVKAKEMNRNYIGCDIGENAFDITNDRLNATR